MVSTMYFTMSENHKHVTAEIRNTYNTLGPGVELHDAQIVHRHVTEFSFKRDANTPLAEQGLGILLLIMREDGSIRQSIGKEINFYNKDTDEILDVDCKSEYMMAFKAFHQ